MATRMLTMRSSVRYCANAEAHFTGVARDSGVSEGGRCVENCCVGTPTRSLRGFRNGHQDEADDDFRLALSMHECNVCDFRNC
jgi:hypothetical protein